MSLVSSVRSLALLAAVPVFAVQPSAAPAAVAMTMSALPHGTFVLDRAPDLDKGIAAFAAQASGARRDYLIRRLKAVDPLYQRVELGAMEGSATFRFEQREPMTLPLDGHAVVWTREDGEVMQVSARPSLSGVLQTYKASDGERTNEFTQLPDGRLLLSVQVHVNGLSKDLNYKVIYRAAN